MTKVSTLLVDVQHLKAKLTYSLDESIEEADQSMSEPEHVPLSKNELRRIPKHLRYHPLLRIFIWPS